MNRFLKLSFILAVTAVAALSSFSCTNAETEEETPKYMEGEMNVVYPRYAIASELITMSVEGIAYPEDPTYKWTAFAFISDTLASRTVTLRVPDSLADYSITAFAVHQGFYASEKAFTITAIDTTAGESSIVLLKESDKKIFDKRDGQFYSYIKVGNLDWFAQNLAYTGAGVPYMNSPALHSLFGRFYNWDEATGGVSGSGLGGGPQGVCPEGWSVPTNEDWEDLAEAVLDQLDMDFFDDWSEMGSKLSADALFNCYRMWPYSPENDHENTVGWNAIPVGASQHNHRDFTGYDEYGFWWSSTQKSDSQAYFRYIYYDDGNCPMNFTDKRGFGATVRCVRLSQ